jgi:membrane-associated phospholipid phosphatase
MWEQLLRFDRALFENINSVWTNPLFDAVMPFMRHYLHWAPLYLFLALFVLLNFKTNGIWWMVFFLVTVALTDMTGTYIFKHNIGRVRPCNDPVITHLRLLLERCAGGSSFISNHAANHLGMGMFIFITFRKNFKNWAWLGIAWAVLIAYSQVYVGVHYPLDVICGALLGLAFGGLTGTIFNKKYGFAIFGKQPVA